MFSSIRGRLSWRPSWVLRQLEKDRLHTNNMGRGPRLPRPGSARGALGPPTTAQPAAAARPGSPALGGMHTLRAYS